MGIHKSSEHPFGSSLKVERYRLDNGLTILLMEDHSAPVISLHTWLGVGSRHERVGKTGICHLFEHLMFGATKNMGLGELDRRLEAAGAESNAATFLDWTYYLINLPKEALPLALDIEADRLRNLVLEDDTVARERDVVANERRQTVDDDVDGSVSELLYGTAFETHGYRGSTIGSMADIQGMTTADCLSFYATYYAPNNATLVLVGDFDTDATLAQIAARYGDMPVTRLPIEDVRPEPPQVAERRVQLAQPVTTERLSIGYHSAALGDVDHAPLVLLNEILFGGRASRVHRALVEQQELASEVYGYIGNFRDPSLWEMHLQGHAKVNCAQLQEALDGLLDAVCQEPVDEAELERVQASLELGLLQGLQTANGRAEQLGFSQVVLGDPMAMFRQLDAYRGCSQADLLRVARRYLRRGNRTAIEVTPSVTKGSEEAA